MYTFGHLSYELEHLRFEHHGPGLEEMSGRSEVEAGERGVVLAGLGRHQHSVGHFLVSGQRHTAAQESPRFFGQDLIALREEIAEIGRSRQSDAQCGDCE